MRFNLPSRDLKSTLCALLVRPQTLSPQSVCELYMRDRLKSNQEERNVIHVVHAWPFGVMYSLLLMISDFFIVFCIIFLGGKDCGFFIYIEGRISCPHKICHTIAKSFVTGRPCSAEACRPMHTFCKSMHGIMYILCLLKRMNYSSD